MGFWFLLGIFVAGLVGAYYIGRATERRTLDETRDRDLVKPLFARAIVSAANLEEDMSEVLRRLPLPEEATPSDIRAAVAAAVWSVSDAAPGWQHGGHDRTKLISWLSTVYGSGRCDGSISAASLDEIKQVVERMIQREVELTPFRGHPIS
jgi:hypothetical protein